MSLRFRRSIKLIPGVRLNFSKSAIGLSVGVPGARVSVNTRGDVYTSAGIPGTGLYSVKRSSLRGSRRHSRAAGEDVGVSDYRPEPKPPKPSFIAGKRERAFFNLLNEHFMGEKTSIEKNVIDLAVELAAKYPRIQYTFLAIACLAGSQNAERFPALLETTKEVWANRKRAFTSFEARKYFPVLYVKIEVSPGIWFDESFGLEAFGYLYAEILQDSKDFVGALKILEKLEATQLSAVSAVDIELSEEKYQDVLESTEEVELEDEATGMLYIMRAAALSELGFHDGALEAIKRVVAKRSLDEEVRNRALWERANIYERQGKRKAALKELEKILLADSKYPDVMSRIEKLRKEENE